jgi:hypothetical protein
MVAAVIGSTYAPLCINCRWCTLPNPEHYGVGDCPPLVHMCVRPRPDLFNMVVGKHPAKARTCADERDGVISISDPCGRAGQFFTPRPVGDQQAKEVTP